MRASDIDSLYATITATNDTKTEDERVFKLVQKMFFFFSYNVE
jgi:hypothetical protein